MYSIGQVVRYGTHGICSVEDITVKIFCGQELRYYVLKPVHQESATIFVPVDNEKLTGRMQRLLTAQQILEVIGGMDEEDRLWIDDDAQRRDAYNEILRDGDRVGMARIIKTLFLRQQELAGKRKKLHIADEKILKETERVLYEEFAYVLGIGQDEVLPFILQKLGVQQVI